MLKAGYKKPAEILGKVLLDISNTESFATREQFSHLEKEQADIVIIRQTMTTKSDLAELKAELKSDIASLKSDNKWSMNIIMVLLGGLITLLAPLGIQAIMQMIKAL